MKPPLIVHVIHALNVGGLENGLVNLVNHMPPDRFRHAVVCMDSYGSFRQRIERKDVEVIAMNRGGVPIWRTYLELHHLFRRLDPSIVHTRNMSGLDAIVPALLSGIRTRIHGEHGRDANDIKGSNAHYRRLRRLFRPLITHYTAVSRDLADYLIASIGVPSARITQIYNGVNTNRFHPRRGPSLTERRCLTIGTVGRLQPVKNQLALVHAFIEARRMDAVAMHDVRLVIAGDGPLRAEIAEAIAQAGLTAHVFLIGERDDVPAVMRSFDLFVLPSLDEGISNTILEAMASGLPVLATRVGGNEELVRDGKEGQLVPSGDTQGLARWILRYVSDESLRREQGGAARRRAERHFSLDAMVSSYTELYERFCPNRAPGTGLLKKSSTMS